MPYATCTECHRAFNLEDEEDASEWYSGHDCEPVEPPKREFSRTELRRVDL